MECFKESNLVGNNIPIKNEIYGDKNILILTINEFKILFEKNGVYWKAFSTSKAQQTLMNNTCIADQPEIPKFLTKYISDKKYKFTYLAGELIAYINNEDDKQRSLMDIDIRVVPVSLRNTTGSEAKEEPDYLKAAADVTKRFTNKDW